MTQPILMPPRMRNHQGEERRVGVELEMAGLEPQQILQCIQAIYGGEIQRRSRFEFSVINTAVGRFVVELDASYLKTIGYRIEKNRASSKDEFNFEDVAADIIAVAAEQFVPWEIATPPIPLSQLDQVSALFIELRKAGALGTRSSLVYAFGLHLNPELPALDVDTILQYLRSFLCLFDWIAQEDDTDLTRRLTSYINHFDKDYILQVIDPDYRPDLHRFMADYMKANPTRNRTLDLLPLFASIDEPFLRTHIDDPRVKGRPTLHYRLPNCDIDNPAWNLQQPWHEWLEVERLASQPDKLQAMCEEYQQHLDSLIPSFDSTWIKATERWLHKD